MSNYIGNSPGLANRLLWQFTATEDQTVFTGADDNNLNLNFASYVIDVFVNGILVKISDDYTVSNGNSIEFTLPLAAGDVVTVIGVGTFNVQNTYTRDELDGLIENAGGGLYKGNNGVSGNPLSGRDDIFRINNKTLTANTTITGSENASVTGPLTIGPDVVLTIEDGGTLVIL